MHGPPLGPLKPLLHAQSLAESLPEGELDPEGQVEQVLDVDAPEAAEYLPEGQLEQVLDVVAPDAAEYLPPLQFVQASDPEDVLYVPAGQLVQSVPDKYCPA